MIQLRKQEYLDKVHACWIGKSIGGTMGAPYERTHDFLSIKGFAGETPRALPNDDLDLQLVWLQAVEYIGVKNICAYTLGEYWLNYVTPYWSEYGIAKSNMQAGLPPPVSGEYNNLWKHSNGAWIRTEIWATLAPASPHIAAKYAVEDASVDHGAGEGTVAAAFIAAMESAAFVLTNVRALINTGLAYIPADSRVAKTVRLACSCYDAKTPLREARDRILAENADIGDGWFQAPSNIGFVILGLLYGEGDYKKSMLAAINCGDDTDCTGATIGSILGILGGTAGTPQDWRAYVGDEIVTACINTGVSWVPITTCTELTEHIARLAPAMLAENNAGVVLAETAAGVADAAEQMAALAGQFSALAALVPNAFRMPFAFFTVAVRYLDAPELAAGGKARFGLKFINNVKPYGNIPYSLTVRLHLPEGVGADRQAFNVYLPHWTDLTTECETEEFCIELSAGEQISAVVRVTVEVAAEGHYTKGYVPVVFFNRIGGKV